jgi:hypothetical protein
MNTKQSSAILSFLRSGANDIFLRERKSLTAWPWEKSD